jgi:CBS domain-containing protein
MLKETGLYLESSADERFGVLPGEERLVRDVMHRNVPRLQASGSLKEAAEMIRGYDVPAVIVLRDRRLAGILTEHDMITRGMTLDRSPAAIVLEDILGDRQPVACRDHAILAEAARLMADHCLQSIPVVNADGAVVGMLTLLDLAATLTPYAAATWLARVRRNSGEPGQVNAR